MPGPQLSLTTPIEEQLVLRTVEGAVDLLAGELHQLASVTILRSLTSSVSVRISGNLQDLYNCPLYSSAAIPLPGERGETSFLEPLRASAKHGVLAALNQPVTFRAPASLASAITQEFGWRNDPGGWNVNLTSGWMAEIGPLFWPRRFGRLERLPWSTNPVVAEIVVRLAKIRPGHRVLDPFCGSGTLLLAARRQAADIELVGSDHVAASVEIARGNLAGVPSQLSTAPAEELQLPDRSVHRVVANLPFGKRVGSHQDNLRLYPQALAEIARVLTDDGRSVLLTEDKRLLRDAVARTRGLKIVRERVLRFNGATPTAFVLAPNRSRRTTTSVRR